MDPFGILGAGNGYRICQYPPNCFCIFLPRQDGRIRRQINRGRCNFLGVLIPSLLEFPMISIISIIFIKGIFFLAIAGKFAVESFDSEDSPAWPAWIFLAASVILFLTTPFV